MSLPDASYTPEPVDLPDPHSCEWDVFASALGQGLFDQGDDASLFPPLQEMWRGYAWELLRTSAALQAEPLLPDHFATWQEWGARLKGMLP